MFTLERGYSPWVNFAGLVNYISTPETTAFDRSLTLAESIVKNGMTSLWLFSSD